MISIQESKQATQQAAAYAAAAAMKQAMLRRTTGYKLDQHFDHNHPKVSSDKLPNRHKAAKTDVHPETKAACEPFAKPLGSLQLPNADSGTILKSHMQRLDSPFHLNLLE